MNDTPRSGTISDVQKQRRRETRRSIYIDGEFAFGVAEETYVKFALFKGREVDEMFVQEVIDWDEVYNSRQTALRFLNTRSRSRREIVQKLKEKGYSDRAVDETLLFLQDYDLIDDRAFAMAFVHDRRLKKAIGRRKLESELREKGIDRELIDLVLNEVCDGETEIEEAVRAAEKKIGRIRDEDPYRKRQKLLAFLAGRGFSGSMAKEAVSRVMEETDG